MKVFLKGMLLLGLSGAAVAQAEPACLCPAGQIYSTDRGVCYVETRPPVCPRIYLPVCGCDGTSYPNPCVAAKNGVTQWTRGACGTSGR